MSGDEARLLASIASERWQRTALEWSTMIQLEHLYILGLIVVREPQGEGPPEEPFEAELTAWGTIFMQYCSPQSIKVGFMRSWRWAIDSRNAELVKGIEAEAKLAAIAADEAKVRIEEVAKLPRGAVRVG